VQNTKQMASLQIRKYHGEFRTLPVGDPDFYRCQNSRIFQQKIRQEP